MMLKRNKISLIVFLLFLWWGLGGCISETPSLPDGVPSFNVYSRGADSEESLPEGSTALLNASGGVNIDNQTFTYSNGTWNSNDSELEWTDDTTSTTLIALFPVYEDLTYSQENLYDSETGALDDILIAQTTLDTPSNIDLQFKHLFSRLTLHVHSALNSTLQSVSLTVPKVSLVNPTDGMITLSESETHTTRLLYDDSGDYTFILPPQSGTCTLTLTTAANEVISHSLSHNFIGGYQYECNVVDRNTPGIWNAEDLIAFAHLINTPTKYEGTKTLEDFKTEDGVYRLRANITLTEAQNEELEPIGDSDAHSFIGTFDGGGYTISNLIISPLSGVAGLFGRITSGSVVKNIHLANCSSITITGSASAGVGFIAGRNMGEIYNCSVENATLVNKYSSYSGGIVGNNGKGKVINCYVKNVKITATSGPLGSITGHVENGGHVLNCYALNNTIQNETNCKNSRGGISGSALSATISNCFLYNISFDNRSTNKGLLVGTNSSELYLSNCLYNVSKLKLYDTPCETAYNESYDSNLITTTTQIPVYQKLNNWIDSVGKENYPQITFKRWTTSAEGTVVFE